MFRILEREVLEREVKTNLVDRMKRHVCHKWGEASLATITKCPGRRGAFANGKEHRHHTKPILASTQRAKGKEELFNAGKISFLSPFGTNSSFYWSDFSQIEFPHNKSGAIFGAIMLFSTVITFPRNVTRTSKYLQPSTRIEARSWYRESRWWMQMHFMNFRPRMLERWIAA